MNFVSAFLQTGDAKRNVYVIPLRECRRRSFYWLLLNFAHGLVNSNEHCDHLFSSIGITQSRYLSQFFYNSLNGNQNVIAVRIFDYVLIADKDSVVQPLIKNIKQRYRLGTVVNRPASFLIFGLHVIQEIDMSVTIHGDEKLNAIKGFPVDQYHRKQLDEDLNAVELQ